MNSTGFIFEECECPMCQVTNLANNIIVQLVKLDSIQSDLMNGSDDVLLDAIRDVSKLRDWLLDIIARREGVADLVTSMAQGNA